MPKPKQMFRHTCSMQCLNRKQMPKPECKTRFTSASLRPSTLPDQCGLDSGTTSVCMCVVVRANGGGGRNAHMALRTSSENSFVLSLMTPPA